MNEEKVLSIVKEETERMLELLEISPKVVFAVEKGENDVIVVSVNIEGDDLGFMIGNKGAHMISLQYILGNIVRNRVKAENKETSIAVLLDVGGYRAQKKESIEQLALQKADDARLLGEPVDLMPMSASDRRIVHSVLGKFDDIKTESFGEDRDRYVRISPLNDKEIGVSSEVDDEADETQE